jgi:hypothetical protein
MPNKRLNINVKYKLTYTLIIHNSYDTPYNTNITMINGNKVSVIMANASIRINMISGRVINMVW